jgi:hypothetical protein
MPQVKKIEGSPPRIEIKWDVTDNQDTILAEKLFLDYTRQGWFAFKSLPEGKMAQIFNFQKTLAKIILLPLVEGG